MRFTEFLAAFLCGVTMGFGASERVVAQSVTIVGTQHLRGLDPSPSKAQYDHAITALARFAPTQVCIERMRGALLQDLAADPMRNAAVLSPDTHSRPLGTRIIPLGVEMQSRLAVRPADARDTARDLASRWDQLDFEARVRVIGLQISGYEFHSAVLNWSYLSEEERNIAADGLLLPAVSLLDEMLAMDDEVYALAVPLARRFGLHGLCAVDSQEYEAAGMKIAFDLGGREILQQPTAVKALEEYAQVVQGVWRPQSGPSALTQMLVYMNSDEFTDFDRERQWELLRRLDNEKGAFHRRLMYWHARTAQISSELYRALAQGGNERVMLIIGAAHRPFNEAEMQAQPWLEVVPALDFLEGIKP